MLSTRQRNETLVNSTHHVEDDMIIFGELLNLAVFLVRADYGVDAEF